VELAGPAWPRDQPFGVSVPDEGGPSREALREGSNQLVEQDSRDDPEPVCPARAHPDAAHRW